MLGSPPLKEFVDLWIYVLYGNIHEQLMNLTQWMAYIVNILLVYSISGEIGCKAKWRLFAAFVYAATPIAMVEAYTTQNDEFATMFVLALAIQILDFVHNKDSLKIDRRAIARYVTLVVSIGFIYLSKPSGMFAVVVFAVWLMISCLKRGDKYKDVLVWLVSVICGSAVVILPEVARNVATYGAITDPWQGPGQLALTYDPRLLIINFLKNVGNNIIHVLWFWLGKVWVYIVYAFAKLMHVNADNEIIAEAGNIFELRKIPTYAFDATPNVILTVFLLVLLVRGVFFKLKKHHQEKNTDYIIAVTVSSLLAFHFVKWEHFTARYFLAYFALLAPVLGFKMQLLSENDNDRLVMGKPFNKIIQYIIMAFCGMEIAAVVIFQCFYATKQLPLADKGRGYYVFSAEASYDNQYLALKEELKQYDKIGVYMKGETCFFGTLDVLEDKSNEIEFVMVQNDSKKYENKAYQPDVIVFLGAIPQKCEVEFNYNGMSYCKPKCLSEWCAVSYLDTN